MSARGVSRLDVCIACRFSPCYSCAGSRPIPRRSPYATTAATPSTRASTRRSTRTAAGPRVRARPSASPSPPTGTAESGAAPAATAPAPPSARRGSCGGTGPPVRRHDRLPEHVAVRGEPQRRRYRLVQHQLCRCRRQPAWASRVTNGSCFSPNTCSSAVITQLPGGPAQRERLSEPLHAVQHGPVLLPRRLRHAADLQHLAWSGEAQTYVNNIHTYCPAAVRLCVRRSLGRRAAHLSDRLQLHLTFCPERRSRPDVDSDQRPARHGHLRASRERRRREACSP